MMCAIRAYLSQKECRNSSPVALRRAAQEISLLCTTAIISPRNKERLSRVLAEPVDWGYLLELASSHGITPLVTHNLIVNGFSPQVPEPYLKELKQTYHGTVYGNLILSSELAGILSTFNEHGIEAICLKGAPLSDSLYGNPCLRTVGDMDILVHLADISQATALLTALGYRQVAPQQGNSHPFHGGPFWKKAGIDLLVELHWHLDDNKLVTYPEHEIWRRAQPLQFEGVATLVLSPEDNFLFLANHLFKHNTLLKLLTDIAELLKKYGESLDWEYIRVSARNWQIAPAVYYALRRIKELTDTPVPDSVLEAIKPGIWRRWLLDYLLSRETFISPIKNERLRNWTKWVARSLMMKSGRQTLYYLYHHEDAGKTGKWPRIIFWAMVVFVVGLRRYRLRYAARPGLAVW